MEAGMKAGWLVLDCRAVIMMLTVLTALMPGTAAVQDISKTTIEYKGESFLYTSLDKAAIDEGYTHLVITIYSAQPDDIASIEVRYYDSVRNESAPCRNEYQPLRRGNGMVSVDVLSLNVDIANTPRDVTVAVSINGGRPVHHETARFSSVNRS
jgi:hypothetical protein